MLKLFLLFIKINLLTTSGPASLGLTKELVVPKLVSESDFSRMIAVASGVPGSDAIQMAAQVGYSTYGILGSIIAVLGALIPCLLLLGIAMLGISYIKPEIMSKFFAGVNPALAVMLVLTAVSLFKFNGNYIQYIILIVAVVMFYFKVPLPILLILCGVMGVFL